MTETAGTVCPAGTVPPGRDGTGAYKSPVLSRCATERPDRAATAARWRREEAARLAIMGDHAGTAEGVRLLIQHDPGHQHAHTVLEAVTR